MLWNNFLLFKMIKLSTHKNVFETLTTLKKILSWRKDTSQKISAPYVSCRGSFCSFWKWPSPSLSVLMLGNALRHFWQCLGFAGCLDFRFALLWKTCKALSHRKRSCLCLEFHWTQLLAWAQSGLSVWIANFPITVKKQAEASGLGLHAGVWLISQFASCGLCWHVSLVNYIQPGGKLLTHSQESAHRGSLPTGQPGITQTHLGKYLGKFWVR